MEVQCLIRFLNQESSRLEKKQILSFLKQNPHYVEVMKGLTMLKKELEEEEDMNDFLERKQQVLKSRVFDILPLW